MRIGFFQIRNIPYWHYLFILKLIPKPIRNKICYGKGVIGFYLQTSIVLVFHLEILDLESTSYLQRLKVLSVNSFETFCI